MKKTSIAALTLVAGLLLGTASPARAGASEDAALALGAFAVFNQIVRGETIFHSLAALRPPAVVAPPAVVHPPPPPPPAFVYAPAPVVAYPHGSWVWRGAWVWVPRYYDAPKHYKYGPKRFKHHGRGHAW